MTLADFSARGVELAKQFRGKPRDFFAALAIEFPDSNLPTMLEREFKRSKGEVKSASENLRPIFAALQQAPVATPAAEVGEQVLRLATHPSEKVSKPLLKGLERALAAQGRITAEQFISENASPTMTRSEFDKLPQNLRGKFFKSGGKLVDDPEPEVEPLKAGATTATLAQLHTLPHNERAGFFRRGGKLISE
jgi:hypothetical protein